MRLRAFNSRFRNTCPSRPSFATTSGTGSISSHQPRRVAELVLEHRQRRLEHVGDAERGDRLRLGTRERFQAADDAADPLGALAHAVEGEEGLASVISARIVHDQGELAANALDIQHQVRERIVDLVRHPGGERPQGGESVGLRQAPLQLLALAGDEEVADRGDQHLRVEGLLQTRVGVDGRAGVRAHGDDRDARERGVLLLRRTKLQAFERRHLEIEEDENRDVPFAASRGPRARWSTP